MISAVFISNGGRISGFSVGGHSGMSEAGGDIVCAAVSAMVMLAVNLAESGFGAPCRLERRDEEARISFFLTGGSDAGSTVLEGLRAELKALQAQYPFNISVKG